MVDGIPYDSDLFKKICPDRCVDGKCPEGESISDYLASIDPTPEDKTFTPKDAEEYGISYDNFVYRANDLLLKFKALTREKCNPSPLPYSQKVAFGEFMSLLSSNANRIKFASKEGEKEYLKILYRLPLELRNNLRELAKIYALSDVKDSNDTREYYTKHYETFFMSEKEAKAFEEEVLQKISALESSEGIKKILAKAAAKMLSALAHIPERRRLVSNEFYNVFDSRAFLNPIATLSLNNGMTLEFQSIESFDPDIKEGETISPGKLGLAAVVNDVPVYGFASSMEADDRNTPQNEGLLKIQEYLRNYFSKNPDVLEKFGIKDVTRLMPRQAILLSSFIAIERLDYSYSQAEAGGLFNVNAGISDINEREINDTIPIEDLLSQESDTNGHGVCRNYVEVVFAVIEALKAMQDPKRSRLNTTYCMINGDESNDPLNPTNIPGHVAQHAWNSFITIEGKKIYAVAVDATSADIREADLLKPSGLARLDYTKERLNTVLHRFEDRGLISSDEIIKGLFDAYYVISMFTLPYAVAGKLFMEMYKTWSPDEKEKELALNLIEDLYNLRGNDNLAGSFAWMYSSLLLDNIKDIMASKLRKEYDIAYYKTDYGKKPKEGVEDGIDVREKIQMKAQIRDKWRDVQNKYRCKLEFGRSLDPGYNHNTWIQLIENIDMFLGSIPEYKYLYRKISVDKYIFGSSLFRFRRGDEIELLAKDFLDKNFKKLEDLLGSGSKKDYEKTSSSVKVKQLLHGLELSHRFLKGISYSRIPEDKKNAEVSALRLKKALKDEKVTSVAPDYPLLLIVLVLPEAKEKSGKLSTGGVIGIPWDSDTKTMVDIIAGALSRKLEYDKRIKETNDKLSEVNARIKINPSFNYVSQETYERIDKLAQFLTENLTPFSSAGHEFELTYNDYIEWYIMLSNRTYKEKEYITFDELKKIMGDADTWRLIASVDKRLNEMEKAFDVRIELNNTHYWERDYYFRVGTLKLLEEKLSEIRSFLEKKKGEIKGWTIYILEPGFYVESKIEINPKERTIKYSLAKK